MKSNSQPFPANTNNKTLTSLSKIAHRLHVPSWLFDYSLTLVMDIPLLTIDKDAASNYTVRPATINDLSDLAICRQMDDIEKGTALFNERLYQDARCYLVHDADNFLLGYAWVMRTGILFEDDDRLRITTRPNGAYIFDTFLHTKARGKGLYTILIAGLQQDMVTQGKTEFHVLVDQENITSIKAHKKLGATICETSKYTTFLGFSYYLEKTETKHKRYLRRYHSHHPCDSLVLNPLDPNSFTLSITSIGEESTMLSALKRIRSCEDDNIETSSPFNNGEIARVWWEKDIKDYEKLFLIEILEKKNSEVVAYGFFRLYEDSDRFLHPRSLVAFDDVYFMSTTLLTRKGNIQAIDVRNILSLSKNVRQIQRTTGADVVIWHRLPPGEISSLARARTSRWNTQYETDYPVLEGLATKSPLESATAKHALRDLNKQGKRLQNKFESAPRTVCVEFGALGREQQLEAVEKFLSILQLSWQHEWMEASERVDYKKYQEKLVAYTDVWIKQNRVKLYITQVAGIDMGYLYTLQSGRSCWCLMTGFNPELRTYSPGKTVLMEMFKQSWESGIREYYLGGNVLGWKRDWVTRCLRLNTMELWLNSRKALAHRCKLFLRR